MPKQNTTSSTPNNRNKSEWLSGRRITNLVTKRPNRPYNHPSTKYKEWRMLSHSESD